MVDGKSVYVTRENVYGVIDVAADFIRTPGQADVLKRYMATMILDTLAVLYPDSAFRSNQTIENSLASLMDGSPKAEIARIQLAEILTAVELPGNPSAPRAREALGMQ